MRPPAATALYRRILAGRFDTLPPAVRKLHDAIAPARWTGSCSVERGQSLLARLAGAIAGLPSQTSGQTTGFAFEVVPDAQGETWSRGFAGRRGFQSRQWDANGLLHERVALMTLAFAVEADADGLTLSLERCWLAGIPLPKVLYPIVAARESEHDGVFHFDVAARLPTGALLVHYRGSLTPAPVRSG